MKSRWLLGLALFACCSLVWGQPAPKLEKLAGPDGIFEIELPGKPKLLETMLFGKRMLTWGAVVGPEGSFMVNVAPSPFKPGEAADLKNYLEANFKNLKVDVVESKSLSLGKTSGHEIRGTSKDPREPSVKIRAVVVKDKLVQVMARGQATFVEGVQARRVFESLRIKE